ncbi:T9SS type B sorting domain-containing protein, partial [Flavobacterium crassostreae]
FTAGCKCVLFHTPITISGTQTATGIFDFIIPLTGGCGTAVMATGTITVTTNNTVTAASATPTLCNNTALTNITHTTTGATAIGTATGLPAGVTAAFASNTITISGTPTAAGVFNYSIPLTGGCGTAVMATGTITVTTNNTVTAASATPTLCNNTALTNITHTTTGATGIGTATGLPAGVTAAFASNTITISGTPTAAGVFNYNIPLTGGCGTAVMATGTITVTTNNTVTAASATPTLCNNTALTNITHTTTGATAIGTATGLPAGVTAAFASNTITISGTPTAAGVFNYNIPLTGGCGTAVMATGTITVTTNNTVTAASATPTLCNNTALTNITHTTTGATAIGTATGLPAGVTAAFASNTITISGTPTAAGVFNYNIPLTGGCGTVSATGTITVTTNNTVTAASATPTLCNNTALTNITHTTTGATAIGTATGLPAGVTAAFASNTITISGTPTAAGVFNYNIPLTGGCGTVSATGTITVSAAPNAGILSGMQSICIGSTTTFSSTGGLGNWITNAPSIATINTTTGVVTGLAAGTATMTYRVASTTGCPDAIATRTVTVTAAPNAGTNGVLELCTRVTPTTNQLFNQLGGRPDTGGTWSNVGDIYTYSVNATAPCYLAATATVTLNVLTAPLAEAGNTAVITCGSPRVTLNGFGSEVTNATYSWSGGTIVSGSNTLNPVVSAPGIYTIVVTNNTTGCTANDTVIVTQNTDAPRFTFSETGLNQYTIAASLGQAPYQYSFDNDNNYGTNPVFKIERTDYYTLYVKDAKGCIYSETVYLVYKGIEFPKFFSPDGNGSNDFWYPTQIQDYPNLEVSIYDRYQRLIATFKGNSSLGWDGNYKGKPLPYGDYWYVIRTNNENDKKEYIGGMTLFR